MALLYQGLRRYALTQEQKFLFELNKEKLHLMMKLNKICKTH